MKKWCRIVWFCEFWYDINSWEFGYCIGIWKVEKNVEKKLNEMEWFEGLEKLKKIKNKKKIK